MLELKDISFGYKGKRKALSGINLEFPASGVISVVGPNGSGKSTLLKCINKILKAEGEIFLNDRKIQDMSISQIAKVIGYVPQSFNISFPVTVFDMVLLGRRSYIGWNPSDHDIRIVSDNIERLGLSGFALRNVSELSGGERQKVLIARALAQEPQILLLDEPTSNLDIKHQVEVMRHVRDIVWNKGLLALIAIHDLNLASQYSDQIIMLNNGRVFALGQPQVILTRENIRATYDIDVAIHSHGDVQHVVPVEHAVDSDVLACAKFPDRKRNVS